MKININHVCDNYNTFRANKVKSLFNAERGDKFNLEVDIPIEGFDWSLGLIVGPSGSGKTSIGQRIFPGVDIVDLYAGWPSDKPIIDCIDERGNDIKVASGSLSAVGLGDVPAWLRPFKALSNGQKFRAGLARVVCDAKTDVIVDEFTSVVDRQIAKVGAQAFSKSWRRRKDGLKAVLLSCHYDVIEYLQPDWVYDVGTKSFKKKAKSGSDHRGTWKFGRQTRVIGECLKHITI